MGGGGPKNVTSTTNSTPPAYLTNALSTAAGAASSAFSANQANGLNDASVNLVGNTIAGDYLSPDSSPYLAQTFNRAADLTRTRLSSEFAGSGRDLTAAIPARSEELQTLASNIYGGNFQAERDRQLTAVGQAAGLNPLNQFIDRIAAITPNAGGTTSSTQPVFRQGLF